MVGYLTQLQLYGSMLTLLGAVPAFTEASNPELQALFSSFRDNVFLPAHLSKAQRDLVYGTRHQKALENEPVTVEVADEEFELKHIDRTRDVPGTIKGLFEIIGNMKDKRDWSNLPVLLEGLKTAGRKVDPKYLQKLVRKAGQAGRQDVILECARQVAKTGFQLQDYALVRQIFFWIDRAPENRSTKGQTRGLRLAEQTALIMEDERHSGGHVRGNYDPRVRPEVIGVLLHVTVRNAKKSAEASNATIEEYAQRLLASLERNINIRSDIEQSEDKYARNEFLCYLSPLIAGMRGAIEILGDGSGVALKLKEHERRFSDIARIERRLLEEESRGKPLPHGGQVYDELVEGSSA
jgi:hypothetical protein